MMNTIKGLSGERRPPEELGAMVSLFAPERRSRKCYAYE